MNLILKLMQSSHIIFLLCVLFYFRVTGAANVDIKVQNTKWLMETQIEPVYEKDMLDLLNNMETLETVIAGENAKLRFEVRDIDLLTKVCPDTECVYNKKTAVIKYKRKIEALQCVNAAIVYHALRNMNYFRRKVGNIDLQKTAGRMLSLLYSARISAHNWLWSFYFKMGPAPAPAGDCEIFEIDKYYPDERLQDDIVQHLELCRSYRYLPDRFGTDAGQEKFEKDKIMKLRQSHYKDDNSTDLVYLRKIYAEARLFKLTNLTLCNVFQNQNMLFHKLGNVAVSFEETKLLLNTAKLRPVDTAPYTLIMRLIKTNVLYLLWKHTTILYVSLKRTLIDPAMNVTNRKVSDFKNSILPAFNAAVRDLGLDRDLLFVNIEHNLSLNVNGTVRTNRKVCDSLNEMNKDVQNVIVENLTALDVNPHQIEALFRPGNIPSNVDQMTNLNSPLYREHVEQLSSYVGTVKSILDPVNFHVVEFFLSGKSKLIETFFMFK